MRRLALSGVVAVLLAGAMIPSTRAAQAAAPNPLDGPGCLGVPAEACVRWLQATMRLDEGLIPAALARRHRVDVNGRRLGQGLVNLTGRLPDRTETLALLLHLNPDDTVASVEASLMRDLIPSTTEAAYDQSGVYEIVARILGHRRDAGVGVFRARSAQKTTHHKRHEGRAKKAKAQQRLIRHRVLRVSIAFLCVKGSSVSAVPLW